MKPISIYVHIPFCQKKCGYCDFNSIVPENSSQIKNYLKALERDIQLSAEFKSFYKVKSLYIGGGTPSFLDAEDISAIILQIKQCFDFVECPELSIEANPASVHPEKLSVYKQAGINRISLGVQSFSDANLDFLQRVHDSKMALNSIEMLRQCGFSNISIDLIYGLQRQTLDGWEADLKIAVDYDVDHISLYDLKVEKGTPFYEIKDTLHIADNALQAAMYKKADIDLVAAGFEHYEISSFAKPGKRSQHNLTYWYNQEYLGFGAGAFSCLNGERFSKVKDLEDYQKQAENSDFEHCGSERLGSKEKIGETLMLNLRLLDGFKVADIEKRLNLSIDQALIEGLDQFVEQGFLLKQDDVYKLSRKGLMQYDFIASELLA
jgi:oxygen-independent coproporphyrinogen-3 oxidase